MLLCVEVMNEHQKRNASYAAGRYYHADPINRKGNFDLLKMLLAMPRRENECDGRKRFE